MPDTNPHVPGCGFHHVAIRARDFDASVAFYTQVLGFGEKIAWGDAPTRAIMLDTGDGNYLEIFERPDQPIVETENAILHLCLRVDDTRTALERVRAAGCDITVEPKDIVIPSRPHETPVTLAFFKGPDGEVIELFQNQLT